MADIPPGQASLFPDKQPTLQEALEAALRWTDTWFQNRVRADEFIMASNWSYLFADDVRIVRAVLGKSTEMIEVEDWDKICELEQAKKSGTADPAAPSENTGEKL